MINTLKKYQKDIIFLTVLTLIVLPSLVAVAVFAAAGSLSPGSHNYGNVTVGNSAQQVIQYTNTSPSPISGSVSVGSGFACIGGGCSYSNLAPGNSRAATIRFSPTSATNYATNANFSSGGGTTDSCSATETAGPVGTPGCMAEYYEGSNLATRDLDIGDSFTHFKAGNAPGMTCSTGNCTINEFSNRYRVTCGSTPPPPPATPYCIINANGSEYPKNINEGELEYLTPTQTYYPHSCTEVDGATCTEQDLGLDGWVYGCSTPTPPPTVDSCVITWNLGGFPGLVPLAPGQSHTIYNGSAPSSAYTCQSSPMYGYCLKDVYTGPNRITFRCTTP